MLIGIKNASKLIGISIISCCAVLICTMFLNFYLDVQSIKNEITSLAVTDEGMRKSLLSAFIRTNGSIIQKTDYLDLK